MKEHLLLIKDQAQQWCAGKNWIMRLALLLFFVYVLIRHLSDPLYNSVLGPLNLGIHELGHLVFSFTGEFMAVLGGTLLQLLIPIFSIYNFYRLQDFFAIALSFGWLSTNLFYIATYMADARKLELVLVSPFGSERVYHDWEYLFSRMNVLQYDGAIATVVRLFAVVFMCICFLTGSWLIWKMIAKNGQRPLKDGL